MNTDSIREYLKQHLSEKRQKHIEGVRQTAVRLAGKYGEDPEKAETAALFHDMFKERNLDDLVEKYGLPDYYKGKRNLAHSKVAAAYMEQELHIHDQDLLNAVSFHTTGRPGMSKLEQILFLADAMEPGRDYEGVDELRKLTWENLDRACLFSLTRTVEYVNERKQELDPDSLRAKEYYEERVIQHSMDSKSLALEAVRALDEKQGIDITAIDVIGKSSFTDYLIVAGGNSERHAESLADACEDHMAELGQLPRGSEGRNKTGWILLDFGDFIVNVFTQEMREKYNIEGVWGDCERLDLTEVLNQGAE